MGGKGSPSLAAELKEFITRGKTIDLAAAAFIGAACSNVVNSVVSGFINLLVGAFGMKGLAGYSSCRKGPCKANGKGNVVGGAPIMWGSVLSVSLTFPITAAAVAYSPKTMPTIRYLTHKAARCKPLETAMRGKTPEADEIVLLPDVLVASCGGASS